VERFIPAWGWLRRYRRADLPGDLAAGLIVAVMLIPQGMAYALMAGLPPIVGLYAATVPLIAYALLGSSRHLAVGPVAIVSILTLSGVGALAEPGSAEFVALAALLALLVGVIQFVLGLLRGGFLVNFLSHAVISGFTSAAAIIIALNQLTHLLGVKLTASAPLPLLGEALARLGEAHILTLLVGLLSIGVLLLFKRRWPRFPAALLLMALAIVLTYLLGLYERGLSIVGQVPAGLPSLALPILSLASVQALLPTALTIAFVGFVESVAVAKSLAAKVKAKIDADQELRGLGLANVAAATFSGYPVTGGFARSAINFQAGARTPLASILTAILIMLMLLFFTPLFTYLPKAVLAAVAVVAVIGLIDLKEPRHLFKIKRIDAFTLLLTFGSTLLIGIEPGIVIGILFSLGVFIWHSATPHAAELGYLPEERVFRNVRRYPGAVTSPEALILRVDASLYFTNMAFLDSYFRRALAERPQLRYIVMDFSGVNDMDAVAVGTLAELIDDLAKLGIAIRIAAMKGQVRDLVAKAGWQQRFGRQVTYPSLAHAVHDLDLLK